MGVVIGMSSQEGLPVLEECVESLVRICSHIDLIRIRPHFSVHQTNLDVDRLVELRLRYYSPVTLSRFRLHSLCYRIRSLLRINV